MPNLCFKIYENGGYDTPLLKTWRYALQKSPTLNIGFFQFYAEQRFYFLILNAGELSKNGHSLR